MHSTILRSALDIAWVEIVNTVGCGATTKTHFPIRPDQTKEWLESVLPASAGIDTTSPIFDFMVNRVKSYKGGDADLLALHILDIHDKHELLIPVLTVTGIKGVELKNEDGSVDVFDIAITRPNTFRKTVGLETEIQYHGKVVFHIEFDKGTPTEGLEIISTLVRFHTKTTRIVRTLQRMKWAHFNKSLPLNRMSVTLSQP